MSTLLQKPEAPRPAPSARQPELPHRFQQNRTPALNLGECVRIALQGLAANKLRAMLTMLGIIIGVGAVITMIAVGQGARQKTLSQIQALGTNVLIIQSGQTKSGGVFGGAGSFRNISFDDLDAILKKCPAVAAVTGEDITTAQVKGGRTNTNTTIVGIGADYADIRNFNIASGRDITLRDIRGRSPVCILGAQVAQDFFKSKSPIDQRIRINSTSYRVVGVMARKGQVGSQNADDQVFLPLSTFQHKLGQWWWRGRVATADIQAVSASKMDDASAQIKSLMRQRHHVKPDHPDDITINNQAEIAAVAEQTTRTFTFLLASIAGVSLLVGGIGIMNIMLVSVTERTREIGVRKAIGAKRRDILWQFLIESVVLSLLGGVIGIAIGIGGALLLGHLSTDYTPILTLPPILLAFGFAAAVGIFFGFYPAQKASRLSPIEALRYE
jgi:putative ABC transport system permease protein